MQGKDLEILEIPYHILCKIAAAAAGMLQTTGQLHVRNNSAVW